MATLSMRHPGAPTEASVAMRKRNLIVRPFTLGPKLATVVT